MGAALALCCAVGAAALWCAGPTVRPDAGMTGSNSPDEWPAEVVAEGWVRRLRPLWSVLAALVIGTLVAPPLTVPAAAAGGVAVWVLVGRLESAAARATREQMRRDLPHVVGLLADALGAGQSPSAAIHVVTPALPGPTSDLLGAAGARLALGVDPSIVWAALTDDPVVAPLGRTMARAHASGASVHRAVERLAESLAETGRAEVEDRARAVGVKAALPLGLCLLPSFLLLGIVPVVAGLLGSIFT